MTEFSSDATNALVRRLLYWSESALYLNASHDTVQQACQALAQGADPNVLVGRRSALGWAVERCCPTLAQELLAFGAGVEHAAHTGEDLLLLLCRRYTETRFRDNVLSKNSTDQVQDTDYNLVWDELFEVLLHNGARPQQDSPKNASVLLTFVRSWSEWTEPKHALSVMEMLYFSGADPRMAAQQLAHDTSRKVPKEVREALLVWSAEYEGGLLNHAIGEDVLEPASKQVRRL